MKQFTTTIIGSGSAKPRNGNLSSCQLLNYNNKLWLIDCCDGACTELLRMNISINKIERVFITHAHGDHCLGLPCLIATMGLNSKTTPLTVYAPEYVFDILRPVIDAMCGKKELPFDVTYQPVCSKRNDSAEIIYGDNDLNVQIVSLRHGTVETYGYVFSEQLKKRHINMDAVQKYGIPRSDYEWIREHDWTSKDGTIIPNSELTTDPEPVRSYGYVSDTCRFNELPFMLNGVTTLYCEASFMDCDQELAAKWGHCTSTDAALLARDAKTVKRLVIGHISARYNSVADSVAEAQKTFEKTYHADKTRVIEIE